MVVVVIDAAAVVVVVVFICNHFPFWIWIGRRHTIWRRVANLRPGAAAGMKGVSGHCGDGILCFSLLVLFLTNSCRYYTVLVSCS